MDRVEKEEMMRLMYSEIGVILAAIFVGLMLLTGCANADMLTDDQICAQRFGSSGQDYWNCRYLLQRQDEQANAIWSQIYNRPTINPLQYMPPTIYVQQR